MRLGIGFGNHPNGGFGIAASLDINDSVSEDRNRLTCWLKYGDQNDPA